jgi:DNA topoisomerase IA
MNLMIVESPNKVKKIKTFLGHEWDVAASVGRGARLATYHARCSARPEAGPRVNS